MLPEFGTKEYISTLQDLNSVVGKSKHIYYQKTVDHAEEMSVHVEGKKPERLLNRKRPHEDPAIKEYRLESYESVTKALSKRVISVITRALNDKLYAIDFPESPTRLIPENEWLPKYLEEKYPYHITLMNFIRKIYIPKALADPNAVVYVEPLRYDIDSRQFFKPICKIAGSEKVLKFEEDEYYIIRIDQNVFKVIDTETIRVVELGKDTVRVIEEYYHGFGEPPAVRLGGVVQGEEPPYFYESFIAGVVPHWNKVITLTSEEDAGIISHLHMEKWKLATEEEEAFPGASYTQDPYQESVNCDPSPQTAGHETASSSYKVIELKQDALNPELKYPIPPAGYIEKNMNILEHTKGKIEQEELRGFSAINMDILSKVGEIQSGVAKQLDREDLDGFLMSINDHIFDEILPKLVFFHSMWRYSTLLTRQQIEETLPMYTKPQSTNVLSIEYLTQELNTAQNLPSSYKKRLAIEITDKRFSTNEKEKRILKHIILFDPFYGESAESLMINFSSGVINKEDWFKHIHIEELVRELVENQKDFLNMDYLKKVELLDTLVAEKIKTVDKPLIDMQVNPDQFNQAAS